MTQLTATNIEFKVGDIPFVLDLVEAEMKLEEFEVDSTPSSAHLPQLVCWIEQEHKIKLSMTQAMQLRDYIRHSYLSFKKKLNEDLKSSFPSVYPPSHQQTENSNSLETVSRD